MEQKQKELLSRILPLVGGKANVTRHSFADRTLYVTLKDRGAAELEALQATDGVTGVELTRGRLKINLDETYSEEENNMADNKKIAQDILEAIGGKENVTLATHCMTRLRLTLKDTTQAPEEVVKNIPGVMGVVQSGGQYQIIVGQNVPKVYAEFCDLTGLATQAAINENLDKPKEKLTVKSVFDHILDYLSGTMVPLIPVMMVAALFKMLQSVLGPELTGVISTESDLYLLLGMLFNAFFYFLPIYAGYTAAKKLNASTVLGLFIGAMLVVPEFVALADAELSFSVFGIPAPAINYTQTVLPVVLSVWVFSLIERLFKKIIPDVLSTIFVPFLSMFVTVPLAFCVLAPLGSILGDYIGSAMYAFSEVGGFIAVAVIACLWEFLVMSGMHVTLITLAFLNYLQTGVDFSIMPAGFVATFSAFGLALGAFLRLRNKQEKTLALGYFVSGFVGGVTEPALYGIGLKYKRPFITMAIGGALGGLYAGIMHVGFYVDASSNFLGVLCFAGGEPFNFVNGIIACVIAMLSSAVLTYLFGFTKEDLKA